MGHRHDVRFRKVNRGGKRSSYNSHTCSNCGRGLSKTRIRKGERVCSICESR